MPGPGDATARLEALNRLTVAINATLDLPRILRALERECRPLIDFERISFALLERRAPGQVRVYHSERGAGDAVVYAPLRGTIAQVVRSRRPVIRTEIDPATLDLTDPTDAAFLRLGLQSLVCLPLETESELIGTLNVSARPRAHFGERDLPMLQQIAAQLALAIDKARLLGEERRRAERMRLLNDVAQAVASSLDTDAMLTRVVHLVHRVFDFVHLSAFVLEPAAPGRVEQVKLIAVAGRWAAETPVGWCQEASRGVIGRAVQERRPYLAGDTSVDPNYVPYPGIDSRTELAVPIIARGEVRGVLNSESHLVHAFDGDDVQTLVTIADQLASGMANAALYAEVAGMNERLEHEVRQATAALAQANAELARQKDRVERENLNLRATLARRGEALIGKSPKLKVVLQVVDKIAASDIAVLIQGESGTGKELIAARVHRMSSRAGGPYVTVNAGAFPENLLESELFGHEAGAFTGAVGRKPGLVEAAEGGTLFLDEIGEVAPQLQAKLLRFLQDGEYYRVGAERPQHANVRIITATNRDLVAEVAAGRFREDLLFRINTIVVELPPLRERAEDIPELARFFLERFRRGRKMAISDLLMTALVHYPWPGNVRELANVIERLALLGEEGELGLEFVPGHIVEAAARRQPERGKDALPRLEEVEREHILRALAQNGGDKTRTARELGIALKTLYNKLARYRQA
jgi:transcriptional regulator with GAF, ATPase, and Fis domain